MWSSPPPSTFLRGALTPTSRVIPTCLIYLTSVEIDRTADDAHVDAGRPFDQPLWQLTTPQGLLIATGEGVVQLAESGLYEGAELTDFLPDRNGFPPSIPLSGDG